MTGGPDSLVLPALSGLTRPRAVVFDWDNTLIDSWHAIQDAQNFTLEAFGQQPWTLEETRQRVRGSMRDSYPALFGARWREAGEVFYRRFAERHMLTLRPLPGADAMLRAMAERGVYLAVCSNKKGDYLRQEADHLGWSGHFGRIIGAFDAPRDKPAADPVLMALDGSGIAPGGDVWFAGDADIDLQCAVNAGCVPVLMRENPPEPGEFPCHEPAVHVEGCMMLSKVFASM
ncbi:MAG: HAD family hydrolase [Rhodospirillales bacterium]